MNYDEKVKEILDKLDPEFAVIFEWEDAKNLLLVTLREAAADAYEDAAQWHRGMDSQHAQKSLGNHRLCADYFAAKASALRGGKER